MPCSVGTGAEDVNRVDKLLTKPSRARNPRRARLLAADVVPQGARFPQCVLGGVAVHPTQGPFPLK